MEKSIAVIDHREHRQLFSLNLIRAVAILMVVFDHSLRSDLNEDVSYLLRLIIGPDAVLFFMVSGALLMPVTGGWGDFLRRRIVRVFIPFVVWVMIYAFTYYKLGLIDEYSLANHIRWGWMYFNFMQGWFIPFMMGVYLIMPLLSPWIATATHRQFRYVMVLWLISGLMPFFEAFGGVRPPDTAVALFMTAWPYAVIGYYLAHYREHRHKRAKYVALLLAGIVVPFALRDAGTTIDLGKLFLNQWNFPTICAAMLYFALMINVKTLGATLDKVVNFIARYSYGIFLTHWFVGGFLIPHWYPALAESTPLIFLIQLAAGILLTLLLRSIPFLGRYLV